MTLIDALTVTVLGMGVVFCGLALTAALIVAFGLLGRRAASPPSEGAAPLADQLDAVAAIAPTPEDAAVVAVITAVLEVERRLHRAESSGRLTITRNR